MEKLWKFEWECGRQGYVEGVFIADDKDVENIIGKQVYFGEILGKHSEVFGIISEVDIVELTDNSDVITVLKESVGMNIGGYNPLDYISDDAI